MKPRLTSTLFVALALYLLFSLPPILGPGFLMNTGVTRIFRTYLVPGPFFTAGRIVDSYSLYLSWKSKGHWSQPICTARNSFDRYNERFNPADSYRSRFERSLYQVLFTKPNISAAEIKSAKEFQQLKRYLFDRYVPRGVDSIRLLFTNKKVQHFKTSVDTLYVILP